MGSSPITSFLGILTAVATILQQALSDHGVPQNAHEWFVLAMGFATSLGLFFAKDYNKTNSPNPTPVSKPVS